MRREAPLIIFAAGLAVLSVALTGGPRAAAEARRDQARADDLRALVSIAECLENRGNGEVNCGKARRYDPFTGTEYEERQSPRRWCARMERLKEKPYAVTAEGCVIVGAGQP